MAVKERFADLGPTRCLDYDQRDRAENTDRAERRTKAGAPPAVQGVKTGALVAWANSVS